LYWEAPTATVLLTRNIAQLRRNGYCRNLRDTRNACKSLPISCVPQKRAQSMPRTLLIRLGSLVRPPRISEHLCHCQISGSMAARQIQGIPPISFDPVRPSRPEPALA